MNENFENKDNEEQLFNTDENVQESTGEVKKMKNKNFVKGIAVFVVVALVGTTGALLYIKNSTDNKTKFSLETSSGTDSEKNSSTSDKADGVNALSSDSVESSSTDGSTVAGVVENVMPSIVSINTQTTATSSFFGEDYDESTSGSGSGIIIGQKDKYILIATNNHVVDGATSVSVVFCDDEEIEATVKGTDSSADLAVVSVNMEDMKDTTKDSIKIASLGDSTKIKVGEMAIAIGNALGYGQSVTVGVISATEREVSVEDTSTTTLIQTDAAINPGNSGGALLNSKGEVIGINSVKYVSEDTEGMGYAIPISDAVPIIEELMNYEEIPTSEQAYLGIVGVDVTDVYVQRYNMPEGVYVYEVSDGSPAQQAGLEVGDIITKIAGKDVTTMEEVQKVLQSKRSGEKADIVVEKQANGKYEEKTYSVTFGSKEE